MSARWTEKRRASGVGIACANIAAQNVRGLPAFKIVGQLWFARPLELTALKDRLRDRMMHHRRFRSRVVTSHFGCCGFCGTCGMTREWEDVEVDWEYHVSEVTFSGSNHHAEMDALLGEIQSTPWDITKPLWRFLQIQNGDDCGRTVLLSIIDHAIGDGVSQIQTLLSIVDDDGDVAQIDLLLPPPHRPVENPFSYFKRATIWIGGTFSAVFGPFLPSDSANALRLKDFYQPSGKISVAASKPIPLSRFQSLKHAMPGFTVNDLLMTVMSLTLYRALHERDDPMTKPGGPTRFTCQLMVDVKQRSLAEKDFELQNSIAPAVFSLPFDVLRRDASLMDVARAVKEQIDELKVNPRPLYQHETNKIFAKCTPQPLSQKVICAVAGKQTTIFANVAGPQKEVSILGSTVQNMSFNGLFAFAMYFGVLSYNGNVVANVTVDREVVDDGYALMRTFEVEFERLYTEVIGS